MTTRKLAFLTYQAAMLAGLTLTACKSQPAQQTTSAITQEEPEAARAGVSHSDAPEPQLVTFSSGELKLHGFLYRPDGAGPFPAIVYNHGSEEYPGPKPDQAAFYLPHGFVLFVPHRRGQGRSHDAGEYIARLRFNRDEAMVGELAREHAADVSAAIAYIRAQPFVDAGRIAVVGCSFGGIETLLAAERGEGIAAAIDFAGGAMMWSGSDSLRSLLTRAAREAKVAVFFIQAENDYNTAPSRVLSEVMRSADKPMRVHVFAANGTTEQEGHGFCRGGAQPAWGPEVLDFLSESFQRQQPTAAH